jgi:hypothetical protein
LLAELDKLRSERDLKQQRYKDHYEDGLEDAARIADTCVDLSYAEIASRIRERLSGERP